MDLTVLVVYETPSFCTEISAVVQNAGCTAVCVSGVKEAQEVARGFDPEVIVLELSSPAIGDMEILQRLQRVVETRHIPLIVVSDYPELEFELLNVFDFLVKPLDASRLVEDLAIISRGGKKAPHAGVATLPQADYRLFHDFLVTHSGLHFEARNQKILERGLKSRMAALKIGSFHDYYDYLVAHQESRQELQKLLQYLAIGETYFFRYRVHYDALAQLLPAMIARKGRIRLWSAGCSTGEEPYSLAMTVMETIPDWRNRDIRILATDINNRALRRAREGIYKAWSMRVIEKRYLEKYFHRIGETYLIKDQVKELVSFSHLNLQTAEFPLEVAGFDGIDAIFCRNVMIYFTLATTRKVIDGFARALVPDGFLFLGHAETLAHVSTQFERVQHANGFYYRKRSGQAKAEPRIEPRPLRQEPPRPPVRPPVRPVPPPPAPAPPPAPPAVADVADVADVEALYRRAQLLYEEEKYREAREILDEIVRRDPDHEGALVTTGFLLANQGEFTEALSLCEKILARNDLLPEAYLLRGLIYDGLDEADEAVQEYRKAILLDMEFAMAHYHLARLLIRTGKEQDGLRELKNTRRILERGRDETVVAHSGGLSREVLLDQLGRELGRML